MKSLVLPKSPVVRSSLSVVLNYLSLLPEKQPIDCSSGNTEIYEVAPDQTGRSSVGSNSERGYQNDGDTSDLQQASEQSIFYQSI